MSDIVRCSRRQAELGERTALKVVKIQCVCRSFFASGPVHDSRCDVGWAAEQLVLRPHTFSQGHAGSTLDSNSWRLGRCEE